MPRIQRSSLSLLLLATTLLAVPLLGQSAQESPAAPVPSQITAAKKVFISNAGEETSYWINKRGMYSGAPNRAYNQLYAALKSWGQYELVSAPADADLIFEIHFEAKPLHVEMPTDKNQFRLLILDPKSRVTLWAFTGYVEPANLAKTRERNYNSALSALVDELKALVAPQTAAIQK